MPGALSAGDAAAVLRDANAEDFLPTAEVAKILGAAGIDPAKETVVYGSRGTWNAYFGRYALRYFGGTKVTVYHEGIEGWQAAGQVYLDPDFRRAHAHPRTRVHDRKTHGGGLSAKGGAGCCR